MDFDWKAIAKRAAQKALAEPDAPPKGQAVWVHSLGDRPLASEGVKQQASRAWLFEENLLQHADGGIVSLPYGARVTPQAEEAARARGIEIREGRAVDHPFGFGAATPPRIAVGCDHGGFALKQHLMASLKEHGYRVLDLGTRDERAADYPDFARAVGEAVADGRARFGLCIDGAGIGSTMTAAKVPGVLPANCWDERTAANAREHNHANVLCLGAGHLDRSQADSIVRTFLTTDVGPGRHARRVEKIWATEARYTRPNLSGAQVNSPS